MTEQKQPETLRGLFCVGVSHRTASLEQREGLALSPEQLETLLKTLRDAPEFEEVALLSTCNRLELYAVGKDPARVESILSGHYQALFPEEENLIERLGYRLQDLEVQTHLFELASGLDSQMIGETEILGQLKAAYAYARELKTTGPVLNRAFQKSFQAGKWARSNTGIGQGHISIGNVAVDLATRIFGDLRRSRILILGSGEVAEKTVQAFQSRGVRLITVASRTFEHAATLAQSIGGAALPFEAVGEHLMEFDIIVASTAAPNPVLTEAMVSKATGKRRARPLFLIDLAHPRDVEPSVAAISNVFVYILEDLAKIANENKAAREAEVKNLKTDLKRRALQSWKQLRG